MSIIKRKNTNVPELEERVASQMLNNIFDACEVTPSNVPLSVLTSYKNYQKERFLFQKVLLLFMVVFFCLFPLLFTTPNISFSMPATEKKNHPVYELVVDSFVPISQVTARIDGNNVPVYRTAPKTYSIEPTKNGEMEVIVSLKNNQFAQTTITVSGVDNQPPNVIADKKEGDLIILTLSDDLSGIDYENILIINLAGSEIPLAYYDPSKETVGINYPNETLNIYIPDKAGNILQLVLSIQ